MEKFIESQYVNTERKKTETIYFERKWEVFDPRQKQMRMNGFLLSLHLLTNFQFCYYYDKQMPNKLLETGK